MNPPAQPFPYLRTPYDGAVSDWHLCPGELLRVRLHGRIVAVREITVTAAHLAELAAAAPGVDASLEFDEDGISRRFRVHRFSARGQPCATIRSVPARPPSLDDIGDLPHGFRRLLGKPEGLILVGGATGAGKSTTLAAAINELNHRTGSVILTLEDPVEFGHVAADNSIVYQCAYGQDFIDWADALKHGLRKDPDVILIGELRDLDTIHAAIHAANTGHLVFASVHGGDVPGMVDRIISAFDSAERATIAALLANAAIGFLAQKLVPTTAGTRCALFEFMPCTLAARTTIRESRLHQLAGLLRSGARDGMQSFDDHIERLLARKHITPETAKLNHSQPENL